MKTFLGIDYGTARIGLALASTPLAEPYSIIQHEGALEKIIEVIEQNQVTDIVFGVSEGAMAKKTQDLIRRVKARTHLPTHPQSEVMSSRDVHEFLMTSQAKKSKQAGYIDHLAAALILQDYLDEQKPYAAGK